MVVLGLEKEFGVKAKIKNYIGSVVGQFTNWEGAKVEKTTVYFLCEYESDVENPKKKDEELEGVKSKVGWVGLDELATKMKSQTSSFGRTDYDESSILERVKNIIFKNKLGYPRLC